MKINENNLLSQLQQLKTMAAGSQVPNVGSLPTSEHAATINSSSFSSVFQQTLNQVNNLQMESGRMAKDVEMGTNTFSLPEAMIASQKAGIAFQGLVQVRNKVVSAYQEVFNMPM